VRAEASLEAARIGVKDVGTVVKGRLVGDWLKLSEEPSYVLARRDGVQMMFPNKLKIPVTQGDPKPHLPSGPSGAASRGGGVGNVSLVEPPRRLDASMPPPGRLDVGPSRQPVTETRCGCVLGQDPAEDAQGTTSATAPSRRNDAAGVAPLANAGDRLELASFVIRDIAPARPINGKLCPCAEGPGSVTAEGTVAWSALSPVGGVGEGRVVFLAHFGSSVEPWLVSAVCSKYGEVELRFHTAGRRRGSGHVCVTRLRTLRRAGSDPREDLGS